MFRKAFIVLSLIIIIILWFIAESQDYFPYIIAPFTQIHAIFLGMLGVFANPNSLSGKQSKIITRLWSTVLICLALYSAVNLHGCNIYPLSLLWIVTAILNIKHRKKQEALPQVECEIQFQDMTTPKGENSYNMDMLRKNQNLPVKPKKWKGKILFTIYAVLLYLFTYNTHVIASYRSQFPILGHSIAMKWPYKHYKVTIHYYCSEVQNSKYPTIVLQHGGGGNLVGFMPLLKELETMGIKVCIYDRLGYGRSSKLIPNQSLKDKNTITELMLSHLLRPDERVIYGGWSAGVQISIAYSYYFPQRVDGLIFMDGYPDYLTLQAIQANSSSIRNPHTLLIAEIFRFFEPYGLDTLFGGNQIANTTFNQYYKAYYQTGYLWDSQQIQVKYMSSTQELADIGKQTGSPLPYPNAKIYLNWPDIKVPLLVMPANNTISGAVQYKTQSEKYIEKCTSSIKKLEVIEGAHDFVTISYQRVANVISQFVHQVMKSNQ